MIYHYTGLDAFMKIVEKKELWASNYSYMNDGEEYVWVRKVTEKLLDELVDKEQTQLAVDFTMILQLLDFNLQYVYPYVLSFSEKGDDLNQWRSYSEDAQGVSMGFNLMDPLTITPYDFLFDDWEKVIQSRAALHTNKWHCFKVQYNAESKIRDYLQKRYEWLKVKSFSSLAWGEGRTNLEMMAYYLWTVSLGFKHDAFKDESEVRLFYCAPISFKTLEYKDDFRNSELEYRVSKNGVMPYTVFDYTGKLSLSEIVLGPKYKGSPWDVRDFLRKNGFDVKIKISEVPYR